MARRIPGTRGHVGYPAPLRWLGPCSCRGKVGFEGFDRNRNRGISLLAPQFAAGKDDRIEPLRVLASADCGGIGKDMAAAHSLDRAELAASVARQAGMGCRIDVARAHGVAGLEPRRPRGRPVVSPRTASLRV